MENVKILDNFLTKEQHLKLKSFVLGEDTEVGQGALPLVHLPRVSTRYGRGEEDVKDLQRIENSENIDYSGDHPMFVHMFFMEYTSISEQYYILGDILNTIAPIALIRAKLNVGYGGPTPTPSGWHVDLDHWASKEATTAVYHLTSNNGYTLMSTGEKVASVANRLITFPSDILHTGVSQTDGNVRAFLNINYVRGTDSMPQ